VSHGLAPRRFLRERLWLASAMWVPVLATNVIAVALALVLPVVDEHVAESGSPPITAAAAQQIFGALAAGMITFTGIIFSAVFVAAQIQTSSYSPRLAARLRRDPVVIAGLALPTATATYALFALAAIGGQSSRTGRVVAPVVTVIFGLVLLVVTLGAFVALVQRAFELTQIGGIFRGLMRRATAVIEDVHPLAVASGGPAQAIASDPHAVVVAHDGPPAVVAAIDHAALLRLAGETGGFVEVLPMVGQFVATGMPVLRIHGARSTPATARAQRVLVVARQRTIDQDPAFVLRMLVDIAIRALSPAVNDPTTAVQALDRIEGLLVELHRRAPAPTLVLDGDGVALGRVPAPTWTDYLELAITEIRHYGAGSVQVGRRLHALYDHLLAELDEPDRARIELERRLLDTALARSFPDPEDQVIAARADRLGLGSGDTPRSGVDKGASLS
jgi:uncharacterized membrane protein